MATQGPLHEPQIGDPAYLDPMIDPRTGEYAVIAPGHTFRSVTQKIAGIVLTANTPWAWVGGLFLAATIATGVVIGITWLVLKGVGIWGVTIPGAWGFAIINFVWWIGIGHAGTLISAILLLFKQQWRNSINRFAEAMTIFAVCCAGIYPLLHVGRPWLAYWLIPYPNSMNVWPQFRSPLAWDVFAVSTYATISVVFWYIGMIPDFGTLRDRAKLPLARFDAALDPLRVGFAAAGGSEHTAGALGAYDDQLRLRGGGDGRLAYDDLPTVLCGRRRVLGVCDGADAGDPDPEVLSPGRPGDVAASGQHGEGHAGDGFDRSVWLRHGSLHELVLGQPLGILHDVEPYVRADGLGILGAHPDQYRDPAHFAVEPQATGECAVSVHPELYREHRDVV
jgi:hypothetical protein